MDAPDSDNIRTLNPDDPPQVETPPIDVGKTLVDLNKSIGLMSDLFVRFISAQADPAQPFERIQSDGELPSSFAHCSVSSAPTGPALSRLDEPLPDMSTGQNLSQGTHLPRGKRPIGPVFGSKAKKHKADTVDFDTVSLCASDEEDDTPSLTAEVAALLPSDKDTGNKGPEADETHVLLDELAKALETPSKVGEEIHSKLAAIKNSRWGKPLAPEKLKPILEKYGRPSNCTDFPQVKVNKEAWSNLSADRKQHDLRLANLQQTLQKIAFILLQTANFFLLKDFSDQAKISANVTSLVDAIALLAHSTAKLSSARRSSIKPALRSDYQSLCSNTDDIPFGPLLFGEDFGKTVKDLEQSKRVGRAFKGSKNQKIPPFFSAPKKGWSQLF